MQMCPAHWEEMKEAIRARNLYHLVHKTGESLVNSVKKQIEGDANVLSYDPLMDVHNMITGRALESGGFYLMTVDAEGKQYCPLCEAKKYNVEPSEWINGASDASLEYAKKNGLLLE
jgi:hypothetical protein